MARSADLTGATFGRWTVLARATSRGRQTRWRCRCSCGTERSVTGHSLRRGQSRSCGCLRAEALRWLHLSHGWWGSAEYRAWADAKQRTTNPRSGNWAGYGGRGIQMAPQWQQSFQRFVADVGPRPTPLHTLERVDVNGHYEPGNVIWATRSRQLLNRRPGPLPASGFHGVVRARSRRQPHWCAVLGRRRLGTFATPQEAAAAYRRARQERLEQLDAETRALSAGVAA